MRRFEISAFLAGTVYFVAIVTYAYVEGQVLHTYFFPLGCARRSACGMGSGPSSQGALFDLGCWSAGGISAQLYRLSVTIRL